MKNFFNWLTPRFLKSLDKTLLIRHPVIWRTRIHLVIYYSILAGFFLFSSGFLYPLLSNNVLVSPINPIQFSKEFYFIFPTTLSAIGILYWGYSQYDQKKSKEPFITVFTRFALYAIGLFFILGLDTTAFRMGTIVHNAYFFIDEPYIKSAKRQRYFIYGYIPHKGDDTDPSIYFKKGEDLFWKIRLYENTALRDRYLPDHPSWNWSQSLDTSRLELLNLAYSLYRSNLKDSQNDPKNIDHLIDSVYIAYKIYRTRKANIREDYDRLIKETDNNRFDDLSYALYYFRDSTLFNNLPSIFKPTENSDQISNFLRSYSNFFQNDSIYFKYYSSNEKDTLLFKQSHINITNFDTIPIYYSSSIPTLYFPKYSYELENMIGSVENARQYLKEWVILRYFKNLLFTLPVIVAFFSAIPFLSYSKSINTFLILVLFFFPIFYQFSDFDFSGSKEYAGIFGIFILITLISIPIFAIRGKHSPLPIWALHFILWIVMFATTMTLSTEISPPMDLLLIFGFGGLIIVLLVEYISRLPKSE